ncbi:hypothetical protein D9Q98_006922 [Chlorella vulgaris]|uniref:Uncharacterized protein n=1 Tax=Chlorella vulgaris TaxID=3077 RepID=A0A9D4YUI7_CHLVU|nr:hypothetical protein D9Q98_006922 [Chlorella vulgaris]
MAMAGWTCLTYASQPTFWQITVYAWSVTITTGLLLLIPEDRVLKARRAVAAGRWRVPRCGVHSLGRCTAADVLVADGWSRRSQHLGTSFIQTSLLALGSH